MRKKATKVLYEGPNNTDYKLPPSAELGGEFVDWNKIERRKIINRVRKRKKNERTL